MVILLCWLPLKENTFTFKTCLGSSVFSLKSYLGKCFLDLLVRFPGLVPLQSLDLSSAQRHLICLFAFKLLQRTADNLTISNYLHCLFVDLRSVNHHLFVNLATIELVRADLHIWTQLQVCHLFSSSILWTSIQPILNTFKYFSILFNNLNTTPSLSSILLFNTLQMKDFCNCCRSKTWKSWLNNSLKKVSERVRQDGGVLSKLKNWMEKWKWFSGGTSSGGNNSKKILTTALRYVVPISFRVCDCSDVVILLLIIVLKSKKLPPWFKQQSF